MTREISSMDSDFKAVNGGKQYGKEQNGICLQ